MVQLLIAPFLSYFTKNTDKHQTAIAKGRQGVVLDNTADSQEHRTAEVLASHFRGKLG